MTGTTDTPEFDPFYRPGGSYGEARTARYMHHSAREDVVRAVEQVASRLEQAAASMRDGLRRSYNRDQMGRLVAREVHHSTNDTEMVAVYEAQLTQRRAQRRMVLQARWDMGSDARKAERAAEAAAAAAKRAAYQAKARTRLEQNRAKLGRAQARLDEQGLSQKQRAARQQVLDGLVQAIKRDAATVGEQPDGTPLEVAAA